MKKESVTEQNKRVFKDNKDRARYELELEHGHIATANYSRTRNGNIALTHTEVPYEYEGKGIGSELVENCLLDIKSQGCLVVPQCPFVSAYIRRHPQWEELVGERD